MLFEGRVHHGELLEDACLHWDDGDVWRRDSNPIHKLCLDGSWVGRGNIEGNVLSWLNGPTVPIKKVSPVQLEVCLDGQVHCGKLEEDGFLHWDDGDVWVREVLESTRKCPAVSRFGFRLYAEVLHNHQDKKELGTVVGFTGELVEVKFRRCIQRCSPANLEEPGQDVNKSPASSKAMSLQNPAGPSKKHVGAVSSDCDRREAKMAIASRPSEGSSWAQVVTRRVEGPVDKFAGLSEARSLHNPARPSKQRVGPSSSPCDRSEAKVAIAARPSEDASWAKADSPSPVSSADPRVGGHHRGIVRWARGSMAWIRCKALVGWFPDRDVFLHRNECSGGVMPHQWEEVDFRLELDCNGNPKAVQATVRGEKPSQRTMVSAAEWFAERAKMQVCRV
jgi:hypothetical protein